MRTRRGLGLGAVLAAGLLAGCGGTAPTAATRSTAPVAPPLPTPVQVANGPVARPLGPRPLAVRLQDTRDPVRVSFKKPPRAGLLFDLDTGQVLWRRLPERKLPIASVTKMMTALLVAERLPGPRTAKITKEALSYTGSGVGVLPKGRWISVQTLLYGLLLPSGNDAAIALAQRVSGSQRAFVALMNRRASELGLACTHFASPSGIVDRGNFSCPTDLAALARAVLDQPRLARIVSRRQAVLPFPIKGGRLYLYNHNPLLKARYPGTLGIKTGFTDAAGRCLVAAVRRNGRRLGVVLLHDVDPGKQAMQLLNRGFAVRAG